MTSTQPSTKGETMTQLHDEFWRVFGNCHVTADGIYADGWPDAIAYRADVAVQVLGRFADGHGTTEAGDAEVCAALEEAGALA